MTKWPRPKEFKDPLYMPPAPVLEALPPDERRDRAKVNEAVRDGLSLGPLQPAGSADLYDVPKATEE